MNRFDQLLLTTALTLAAGAVNAAQLVALDQQGVLHHIDIGDLKVTDSVTVRGADQLRGIDVRPSDNKLYALGNGVHLYTLDMQTGQATALEDMRTALPGSKHAVVDFNPVADRLRLLSEDGTNLRVNVDTGEVVTDGSVAYVEDFERGEYMEEIVAGAYTNAYSGAQETTLYTIDVDSGMLMRQEPPNEGTQKPVGLIAEDMDTAAMDIASDGQGGNTAFVLYNGTLHTVELRSGQANAIGLIADLPENIIDIAILPQSQGASAGE
ncbi:MAG: DUF4394 domain-containing protein [Halopseudomonas sp.]|uniref:DUF4394 domain-containing protein n=1 Tax=Halopseudomonas sp. TaxID=2901191 RepID=UPI0030034DA3